MIILFAFLFSFPLHAYDLEEQHHWGKRLTRDLLYPACALTIKKQLPWDFSILETTEEIETVTLKLTDPPNVYRLAAALGRIHFRYKKIALDILSITQRHDCQDLVMPYVNTLKEHQALKIGIKDIHFIAKMRATEDPATLIRSLIDQTAELGRALNACLHRTSGYMLLNEKEGTITEHEFEPSCWSHLYWSLRYGSCRCCHRRR